MNEKKSFFELLDAKSALLVGLVGGLLTLGTVGFVVLGTIALRGGLKIQKNAEFGAVAAPTAAVAEQPQTPPPANIPKSDRPKVELFVMSYCPFGLQMEKAYAPAWQLLKDKADIDVKFVSYAMHGEKEVEENTRQYCIEKEQNGKYAAYLNCFTASGDASQCLGSTGVNQNAVKSCMTTADKQFGISDQVKDQSKWLSGRYPVYPIHQGLNDKYGVQGSPTLVINSVIADVSRTPEAVKQAICGAFNNPPAECKQQLSTLAFQAGFGAGQAAGAAGATQPGCGT